MTYFNLGDPVTIRRNGIPVKGTVWGRTGATVDHDQRYDVKTDNGMSTYLTAGDLSLDDTRQKIEATR
jgi:hypothetical protein